MRSQKVVGVIYNSRAVAAKAFVEKLVQLLDGSVNIWTGSADHLNTGNHPIHETDVVITVGGDGTILRAAKLTAAFAVPIIGVNLGRIGFMTELRSEDALENMSLYLSEDFRVEERSMIMVEVIPIPTNNAVQLHNQSSTTAFGLNEAVLGRGAVSRLIRVEARVNQVHVASYGADSVMVCTATGSTGYNRSAGGPILNPQSADMVLIPVAPQVGLSSALVLRADSTIELTVDSDVEGILSIDGHIDIPVYQGCVVKIQQSPHKAHFLRNALPERFYGDLRTRLGFDNDAISKERDS